MTSEQAISSSDKTPNKLMPPLNIPKPILFGPFTVTNQIFHITPHSFALTNIRPILVGHVLICPLRPVPRLLDLSTVETTDLFHTVRLVTRMLQRVIPESTAFNVAIQDGEDAGQSVKHVHCHIIPRRKGDMKRVDDVYKELDGPGGDVGEGLRNKEAREEEGGKEGTRMVVDDEQRRDRSEEEMNEEARWFAREMQREQQLQKERREDGE